MKNILKKELTRKFYWRAFKRLPYKIATIFRFFISNIFISNVKKNNIEKIREKHKGETVYIFGSGPSLDKYPNSFLDGKTSIALQLAFMKYPGATYAHITEADRLEWFKHNNLDFFKTQGLYCDPLFPAMTLNSVLKNVEINSTPYFLKYNPKRLKIENVKKEINAAISGENYRYHSNSTCLHTAIWCAMILGFTTIEIVGCEFASNNGNHYSTKTDVIDTRQRTNEFMENAYYKMNVFTDEIINLAQEYDININRYISYTDYQSKNQKNLD